MEINKVLIEKLVAKAESSNRKRMNYDLRTGPNDGGQRMLNAMLPGTVVPIHRHPMSDENVLVLTGKFDEVIYDDNGTEMERIHLDPSCGNFGCVVTQSVWHTVEVFEPCVIYEAKDGKYGEDGSETLDEYIAKRDNNEAYSQCSSNFSNFSNSLGDLKKNIEYLIGIERQLGSMDAISPLYVSRMLNVPLEQVEAAIQEMGL